MQTFDNDQLHYIAKGKVHQDILRNEINDALNDNAFNDNYIISSLPGLGKTYETMTAIKSLETQPLIIEGSSGIFAFVLDITTAAFIAGGKRQVVILDDCDVIFEDKNLNIAKKMFDGTRKLVYGKSANSLRALCSELQWEAVQHFKTDERAGFQVPLDNFTFITLTNRELATINEVENAKPGSKAHSRQVDLHAIRRRTKVKHINMEQEELWGYVANVVLNEHICENFKPKISIAEKEQILSWCFANWASVTERNLSLIEKMTKDMVKYPTSYLNIWKSEYL